MQIRIRFTNAASGSGSGAQDHHIPEGTSVGSFIETATGYKMDTFSVSVDGVRVTNPGVTLSPNQSVVVAPAKVNVAA